MSLKRSAYVFAITVLNALLSVLPTSFLRTLLLKACGMKIGSRTYLARGIRVDFPWRISVGSNCHISGGVYLDGRGGAIQIGSSTDISSDALIYSLSHNIYDETLSPKPGAVKIEDKVWIGARNIILPGSVISEGCVIGAASVTRGTTERYSLYVGNPAAKVKALPETRASKVRQAP